MSGVILLSMILSVRVNCQDSTNTLLQVHVIFRHGDRTPSRHGLWPNHPLYDESNWEPYGYGQLTRRGKLRSYDLGLALKQRYEHFLDTTWNRKIYDAWATDSDRTKMSLQLVLGGLFSPTDAVSWHEQIHWQPVPYNSLPVPQDKELSGWACPMTVPLIYEDEINIKRLRSYDKMITIISNYTGTKYDYVSVLDIYFGMYILDELGVPTEDWTSLVYPQPLRQYIVDFYEIETSTIELKRVLIGYLMKKVINDFTNKLSGTLQPPERKIFLYSGHEVNVGSWLAAMDLFKMTSPPLYCSYIILELHNIHEQHVIKMFYVDDLLNISTALTLPGCQESCPLDEFVHLTKQIIPNSDSECYGTSSSSSTFKLNTFYLVFISWIRFFSSVQD